MCFIFCLAFCRGVLKNTYIKGKRCGKRTTKLIPALQRSLESVRQHCIIRVSLKHDGTDGTDGSDGTTDGTAGTAQQSTGNVACCSARDWTPEQ